MKRVTKRTKDTVDIQTNSEEPTKVAKLSLEDLEKMLGLKLEPWQKQVVLEEKRNLIMRCSRKSGKTTAMAFKIVLDAVNNPNWFVCILSAGQRQSSEVFQTVVQYLYLLQTEFRDKPNATGCTLLNGHRILSLPTGYTGATIRTYSFHKIYFDEAAFIADEVYKATQPCLLKYGLQKIIASTPKGSRGFFYTEWNDGKDFLRFYIPWWEIKHIDLDRLKATIESERTISGDKYIQQEYEALFVEQGAGLIPENLINQSMISINNVNNSGEVYLGITSAALGKKNHYIVFCNVSRDGIQITKLEMLENSDRTEDLLQKILAISKVSKISKIITSETSVGVGTINGLTDLFGKKKILSVESLSYEVEKIAEGRRKKVTEKDMYDWLISLMEAKRIKIVNDPIIEDALRSLDYDFKPGKENEIIIFGRAKVIAEALVYSLIPTLLSRRIGLGRPIGIDESEKPLFAGETILYTKDAGVF